MQHPRAMMLADEICTLKFVTVVFRRALRHVHHFVPRARAVRDTAAFMPRCGKRNDRKLAQPCRPFGPTGMQHRRVLRVGVLSLCSSRAGDVCSAVRTDAGRDAAEPQDDRNSVRSQLRDRSRPRLRAGAAPRRVANGVASAAARASARTDTLRGREARRLTAPAVAQRSMASAVSSPCAGARGIVTHVRCDGNARRTGNVWEACTGSVVLAAGVDRPVQKRRAMRAGLRRTLGRGRARAPPAADRQRAPCARVGSARADHSGPPQAMSVLAASRRVQAW